METQKKRAEWITDRQAEESEEGSHKRDLIAWDEDNAVL